MSKRQTDQLNSNTDVTRALLKFIPTLVYQQNEPEFKKPIERSKSKKGLVAAEKPKMLENELPLIQPMTTIVMFADISGFTNISEACAKLGSRGAEELSFTMNRYMEGIVKGIAKYGGDIIKFVGDAMIVVWPRYDEEMKITARKAIQCAIDIQIELNNKKILRDATKLSVKIGIGVGNCALLHVGGVFQRAEFFTIGEALMQALGCEGDAVGGDIIISNDVYNYVRTNFIVETIDKSDNVKVIKKDGQGVPSKAEKQQDLSEYSKAQLARISDKLKTFVPAAIMPYIEINHENYGAETRRLTVMFASLGIDLSSAQTKKGMDRIQLIVTTIQKQVYRMEGSLNKLVMDDKGSTLICIWGLPPFAHEDDGARAVLTAQILRKELNKEENGGCTINVGISTGVVFSGIVGTSGSRKEFSVLGDVVNVSARIMGWSKKVKNQIFVDMETKKDSDVFVKNVYVEHCEFKGKSVSLPIYEPIDPEEEMIEISRKVINPYIFLKIHSNPMLIDRSGEQSRNRQQYGRKDELDSVVEELIGFCRRPDEPRVIVIQGEAGSGKTLFARIVIDAMQKEERRNEFSGWANREKLYFLASAVNPANEKVFLNSWIPLLRMMLTILQNRTNKKKENILSNLYEDYPELSDKVFLLEKIFGIELPKKVAQMTIPKSPIDFVLNESYSNEIVQPILEFIVDFIQKEVLEENETSFVTGDNSNVEVPPVIIFIDNIHFMDLASWQLLNMVVEECKRVSIVILAKTSSNFKIMLSNQSAQFGDAFLNTQDNVDLRVELPPLNENELKQMMIDLSQRYEKQMKEEIIKMTEIVDIEKTNKIPEEAKAKAEELRTKMNVQDYYTDIQKQIIDVIYQRCEGNPLCSLQFLYNMLTNGYAKVLNNNIYPVGIFAKSFELSDWTGLPVPEIMSKSNGAKVDLILRDAKQTSSKNSCIDATKETLLLKAASVIGDFFSLKQIEFISPLRNESTEETMRLLKSLEQKGLIELIDGNSSGGDINSIFRFSVKFLRETLYQRLLHRDQKKKLHQLSADFIHNNLNIEADAEVEQTRLLNHILVAEDLQNKSDLSQTAKQKLITKRLTYLLLQKKKVMKEGLLTKKGDKINNKVEPRYVRLTSTEFQWFHSKEESRKQIPLGTIFLNTIYNVMPANTDKSTQDFFIGAGTWKKKNQMKDIRQFVFGATDANDRDDWITSIEYLRLQSTYEAFRKKYVNVQLPISVGKTKSKKNDSQNDSSIDLRSLGDSLKKGSPAKQTHGRSSAQNFQSRPSIVMRRSSQMGTFSSLNSQRSNPNFKGDQELSQKDLAQYLKKLYSVYTGYFIGHITENGNNPNIQNIGKLQLGQIPSSLKMVNYDEVPEGEYLSKKFDSNIDLNYSMDDTPKNKSSKNINYKPPEAKFAENENGSQDEEVQFEQDEETNRAADTQIGSPEKRLGDRFDKVLELRNDARNSDLNPIQEYDEESVEEVVTKRSAQKTIKPSYESSTAKMFAKHKKIEHDSDEDEAPVIMMNDMPLQDIDKQRTISFKSSHYQDFERDSSRGDHGSTNTFGNGNVFRQGGGSMHYVKNKNSNRKQTSTFQESMQMNESISICEDVQEDPSDTFGGAISDKIHKFVVHKEDKFGYGDEHIVRSRSNKIDQAIATTSLKRAEPIRISKGVQPFPDHNLVETTQSITKQQNQRYSNNTGNNYGNAFGSVQSSISNIDHDESVTYPASLMRDKTISNRSSMAPQPVRSSLGMNTQSMAHMQDHPSQMAAGMNSPWQMNTNNYMAQSQPQIPQQPPAYPQQYPILPGQTGQLPPMPQLPQSIDPYQMMQNPMVMQQMNNPLMAALLMQQNAALLAATQQQQQLQDDLDEMSIAAGMAPSQISYQGGKASTTHQRQISNITNDLDQSRQSHRSNDQQSESVFDEGRQDAVFQLGLALATCKCKVRPEIQINEDEIVQIEGTISELGLYKCKVGANETGLFPMNMIKLVKDRRSERATPSQPGIRDDSPSVPLSQDNYHLHTSQLTYDQQTPQNASIPNTNMDQSSTPYVQQQDFTQTRSLNPLNSDHEEAKSSFNGYPTHGTFDPSVTGSSPDQQQNQYSGNQQVYQPSEYKSPNVDMDDENSIFNEEPHYLRTLPNQNKFQPKFDPHTLGTLPGLGDALKSAVHANPDGAYPNQRHEQLESAPASGEPLASQAISKQKERQIKKQFMKYQQQYGHQ